VVKAAPDHHHPGYFVVVTATVRRASDLERRTSTTANDYLCGRRRPGGPTSRHRGGSYFLLQVAGPCTAVSAAAIAARCPVGCSTTAGKIDDASITAGVGAIGVATLVAAGADVVTNVYLKGLI
jgi:hypothetical protein